MPTIEAPKIESLRTLASQVPVLNPDRSIDDQERLAGDLAGEWGSSVAHTKETGPLPDASRRIGFKSPSEQRKLDRLLDEIHEFVNGQRQGNTTTPDGEPQGA